MILLTHKSCLDGFACKVVFKYLKNYDENSKIFDFGYLNGGLDSVIPVIKANARKDEDIYIVDVNYKNIEPIIELKKEYPGLVYIDHHKYDDKYYNAPSGPDANDIVKYEKGKKWLYCPKENIKAGGILFYEYAKENGLLFISPNDRERIEHFLKTASDYDTWMWKKNNNLDAEKLSRIYYNIPEEIFSKEIQNYLDGNDVLFNVFFNDFLEVKKVELEKLFKRLSNNCEIHKDASGNKYIWVRAARPVSTILHRILNDERYKSVDYIACYNESGKSVSFRSREGFDVREIAKKYGGGGHAQAAACSLPEHFVKNFRI